MTYQIDIPAEKTKDVLAILKALNVKVKEIGNDKGHNPNAETKKAIADAKAGKVKRIDDLNTFLGNI